MALNPSLPAVPTMPDPGLYELLQAMRKITLDNATQLAEAAAGGGAGAGGGASTGSGQRDPPSFVLDYGGDVNADAALTAYFGDAGAKDMYIRDGEFSTSQPQSAFTKHMHGKGKLIAAAYAAPAKSGYLATKPNTYPVQGVQGWFRGDQSFTDGGEWKIIGPGVRKYDDTARYFESNCIPHHAWFDVLSGSAGIDGGYITAGVTPGNTVTTVYKGPAEWVGKKCYIRQGFGGAPLSGELTVASVVGNTVTFTTSHGVTAPWSPPGSAPSLSFAPRTWAGFRYLLVHANGGGDVYGDIVRVQVQYQPKPNELIHVFNAQTSAQYGGSVDYITSKFTLTSPASTGSSVLALNATPAASLIGMRVFIRSMPGGPTIDIRTVTAVGANSMTLDSPPSINHPTGAAADVAVDGNYVTGWESQFNDNGSDVCCIRNVDSFVRDNDAGDQGGKAWIGTYYASTGSRPSDAAFVALGSWRRGLDTAWCTFDEGSYLQAAASAGATTITMRYVSGARVNQPITIQSLTSTYNGTVTAVSGKAVTVNPALNANYPLFSRVTFPGGGAAIALAMGQSINWDATHDNAERSGDPLGMFGPLYGNKTGVVWSGVASDGAGSYYWQLFVDQSRLRIRPSAGATPGSLNYNGPIQCGSTIGAAMDLSSAGSTISANYSGAVQLGSGNYVAFNTSTNQFEFYRAGTLVGHVP